jgi:guanylate kinase
MQIDYTPFLIIISSPSGAGKTTICKKIIDNDPSIIMSISSTTRAKRNNEINGKDYNFISQSKFDELKYNNEFLEDAIVFDNKYGTLRSMVEDCLVQNKSVLFDIDWQGARQIKEKYSSKNILSIFILPPSIDELNLRLKNRAQDDQKTVAKRMEGALSEIEHFNEYDYVLINDDINQTYDNISIIIEAKKLSLINLEGFTNLLKNTN